MFRRIYGPEEEVASGQSVISQSEEPLGKSRN
jgi:hypothetical protein